MARPPMGSISSIEYGKIRITSSAEDLQACRELLADIIAKHGYPEQEPVDTPFDFNLPSNDDEEESETVSPTSSKAHITNSKEESSSEDELPEASFDEDDNDLVEDFEEQDDRAPAESPWEQALRRRKEAIEKGEQK